MPRGLRCKPRGSVAGFFRDRPDALAYPVTQVVGFIRGHCGKVATKAPPGPCNRCIGVSCGLSSISEQPIGSVHPSRHSPVFQLSSFAHGNGLWLCRVLLIFHSLWACPAYFKGGVTTLKLRPFGHVGLRGVFLNRVKPALPLTRHCQVHRGLCPMTVSPTRTCQPRLAGGQKH